MLVEKLRSQNTASSSGISLDNLSPGIYGLKTGISLSEADRFAHQLEDTGKYELYVYKAKKGERNLLFWNIIGRTLRPGKYQNFFLITDKVLSFETTQLSSYLRGQVELGEYLLAIPAENNSSCRVELYIYKQAA